MVTPSNLVWPTTRVSKYDPEKNERSMLPLHEETEEKREATTVRNLIYKRRTTRYLNYKVLKKALVPGDLVLRNAKSTGHDQGKGKLSPK